MILLVVVLSGCAGATGTSAPALSPSNAIPSLPTSYSPASSPLPGYDKLVHIFDYDPAVPLEVSIGSESKEGATVVQSLTYASPGNCTIPALLVSPVGQGPDPAIIFMHSGGADMTQFKEEAVVLAGQGVVSLLLDSPLDIGCYTSERQGDINTVLAIRRDVDLLQSLTQVDRSRIAYVGYSLGATWGGVVAGVEPRVHAFVLMAGYAQVSKNGSPDVPDLDAALYVGHAKGAAFLFQNARNDEYVSPQEAQQYFDAASGTKSILWYDSNHEGLQQAGQADRVAWLCNRLGVTAP